MLIQFSRNTNEERNQSLTDLFIHVNWYIGYSRANFREFGRKHH
jgi:hypothetical protein